MGGLAVSNILNNSDDNKISSALIKELAGSPVDAVIILL
jgi:hypothetical protein